jgi:geranylgeranyl pyrophosphate synthase
MSRLGQRLDRYIVGNLDKRFSDERVREASTYLANLPGRRFRPAVGFSVYRILGGDTAQFVKAAAGLEVYHLASIIEDDSKEFDDAKERKGGQPVHIKFGAGVAQLSAHNLRELGSYLVRDCLEDHDSVNPEFRRRSNSLIQETLDHMIWAQISRKSDQENREEGHLLEVAFKLNKLFYAGAMLPGYFLQKDEETLNLAAQIGRGFSIGHQLRDDMEDMKEDRNNGLVTLATEKGKDYVEEVIMTLKNEIIRSSKAINPNSRMNNLVDKVLGIKGKKKRKRKSRRS